MECQVAKEFVPSRSSVRKNSKGLTIIEVLFSMVIILVGLVGVAAMVPFAIRQAEDSYKITQGLAAGESAVNLFHSQSVVQPRMDAPWLFQSDVGLVSPVVSMNEYYVNEYNAQVLRLGSTPPYPVGYAVLQNQVIGMGFCIDPLFWGNQVTATGAGNFSKITFPFYNETMPTNYDPFGNAAGSTLNTPRLRRVSLLDTSVAGMTTWLRLPASIRIATVAGGDVIQANAEVDKSAAPLRGEYVDGAGSLIQSPAAGSSVSWMATLTPVDETPVILPEMITTSATPSSMAITPDSFNLAVVVFGKRDVRDLNLDPVSGIGVTGLVPNSERLGFELTGGNATWNSGAFDITISSSANVNARIKTGDWLMLSRTTFVEVDSSAVVPVVADRQRHKWYRVIATNGEETFPKTVRVSGEPWWWTRHEVEYFNKNGISPFPPIPTTAVTLLKDVIQVYERTINLSMN